MLRLFALALLLANGLFYAWDHELLRGLGLGPAQQSEPQRLAQQIKPESVQLLTSEEFKHIEEQAKAEQEPTECLQAGPLDAAQLAVLRPVLGLQLPADSWDLKETTVAPRWVVYMGKYGSPETLAKKRAEVVAMNLKTESLINPALEPGFSLGAYETKAEADSALARLAARGLHTARVAQERAEGTAFQLVLPKVRASLKPKLGPITTALGGKTLHTCN
jgi:hypothetical protein